MGTIKKYTNFKINESQSEEQELINGSGLFFFNSRLDDTIKLEILKWYKSLPGEHKKYVDILRTEASDEAEFFARD